MMTVKHIDTDGSETIFPVLEATFDPRSGGCEAGASPTHGCVHFTHPMRPNAHEPSAKGFVVSVYRGTVYLMNDNGKTVAKYELGGWPNPTPKAATVSFGTTSESMDAIGHTLV